MTLAASMPAASSAARRPTSACPELERRQHGQQAAQHRRQAIGPDRVLRRQAGGPRRRREGDLQPIDADRLAVARLGAVHDPHVVAGLDHLLAGLREPALVAVRRRQGEQPGQPHEQAERDEQRARPPGLEQIHSAAL
ncbi:MAG: hypothetical protein WDN49_26590 [Acetobacteraceae bacterium]